MANYTSNLNLEKPLQTELYNVDVFNANADKIDAGVGARVKYTDALTLEEIIASTDLTDKVASASAAKSIKESLSTLLWTNPSPTSSFGAQDVLLDLSDYDFVEIYTYGVIGGYTKALVGGGRTTLIYVAGTPAAANGTVSNMRPVTASSTGVHFGDCGSVYTGSAVTTNNANLIPYKIYGSKSAF